MKTEIRLNSEYTSSTINISNSNLVVNKNSGKEIYDLTCAESIDIDYDRSKKGLYGIIIAIGFLVAAGSWFLFPESAPQFAITYLQPLGFGIGVTSLLYGTYKLARIRNGVSVQITFSSGVQLNFRTDKENSSIFEQAFFRSTKGGSTGNSSKATSDTKYTPSNINETTSTSDSESKETKTEES